MLKEDTLKALVVSTFANVVLLSQKGYPLRNYTRVLDAMQSLIFIDNYSSNPGTPYYIPPYKVDTILDYHLRELNQL